MWPSWRGDVKQLMTHPAHHVRPDKAIANLEHYYISFSSQKGHQTTPTIKNPAVHDNIMPRLLRERLLSCIARRANF